MRRAATAAVNDNQPTLLEQCDRLLHFNQSTGAVLIAFFVALNMSNTDGATSAKVQCQTKQAEKAFLREKESTDAQLALLATQSGKVSRHQKVS